MGSQGAPQGGQKWENRLKCRKSGRDVSGMMQNGFKISFEPFCTIPDTSRPLFRHFTRFPIFDPPWEPILAHIPCKSGGPPFDQGGVV